MKHRKWSVTVNGQEHTIEFTGYYRPNSFFHFAESGYRLLVDGQKHVVDSFNWYFQVVDHPIDLDGAICHFVVNGTHIDLAVNGRYLGSGEPYEPLSPIPTSITVMAAVSLAGGLLLNGIGGFFVGWLLAILYRRLYLEKRSERSVLTVFAAASAVQIALRLLLTLQFFLKK